MSVCSVYDNGKKSIVTGETSTWTIETSRYVTAMSDFRRRYLLSDFFLRNCRMW